MGFTLIIALVALMGLGLLYARSPKKPEEHQRLLLRLRDPGLNPDTLIAELRYSKTLALSQNQRIEILEQTLAVLAAHPHDSRCQDFVLGFGQWYCAIVDSYNQQRDI